LELNTFSRVVRAGNHPEETVVKPSSKAA